VATQWAFKKLGLPLTGRLGRLVPTVVAVIDTGLDYIHPLLPRANLWINPRPGDGTDGFKNDRIGWNFIEDTNNPWDDNGHGTFVAGLIVGVNPWARIMPLKAAQRFGGARASNITRAMVYAVDHGARVINISLGSEGHTIIEQAALDYAYNHGVLVVVAAGNDGKDTKNYGLSGMRHAFAVAATGTGGRRPPFGNWGQEVAMAAPGVDIISWRARRTDMVLISGAASNYKPEENFVGQARRLYRATGTSFAAPLVAGAASLLWSRDPNLTIEQVKRMLLESADDIEVPGWDQYTGAGELNIAKALQADPNYFLDAKVTKVQPVRQGGQTVIQVEGTADGSHLKGYTVQLGQGENPAQWKTVGPEAGTPVSEGVLAAFPVRELTARGRWSLRVLVTDTRGKTREARGSLTAQ
jgi:subtilisin family serine protease